MTGAGVSGTFGARPRGRFLTPIIILRQKTPPLRAGDDWRPGAPCGRLPAYRRACGKLRLWSGAATHGAHERVRRSRQGTPVRFAVFGPGIPCLQAWGVVKLCPNSVVAVSSVVRFSALSSPFGADQQAASLAADRRRHSAHPGHELRVLREV